MNDPHGPTSNLHALSSVSAGASSGSVARFGDTQLSSKRTNGRYFFGPILLTFQSTKTLAQYQNTTIPDQQFLVPQFSFIMEVTEVLSQLAAVILTQVFCSLYFSEFPAQVPLQLTGFLLIRVTHQGPTWGLPGQSLSSTPLSPGRIMSPRVLIVYLLSDNPSLPYSDLQVVSSLFMPHLHRF